jgi:hypothetical protein
MVQDLRGRVQGSEPLGGRAEPHFSLGRIQGTDGVCMVAMPRYHTTLTLGGDQRFPPRHRHVQRTGSPPPP